MRGIATVDRIPAGNDLVAVWLTGRTTQESLATTHGNAVVVDLDNDPDAIKKVWSLTRTYAVLATEGSDMDGLPIEGKPLATADVEALVAETTAHQEAITAAVEDYKRRTKSKALVLPTFPVTPSRADFVPLEDTPGKRALATANFVAKAWTYWLTTDEERRRRTVQPRTGETPWIMPDELNQDRVAEFPIGFASLLKPQPLEIQCPTPESI